MFNIHLRLCLIVLFSVSSNWSIAETENTGKLLSEIKHSENLIKNVQAHAVIQVEEKGEYRNLRDFNWGYEFGKEFIDGTRWSTNNDGSINKIHEKFAFDGKKQCNFRELIGIKEDFSGKLTGGIYSFTPVDFSVPLTPHTLLGYSLVQNAQESLSESLAKAKILQIKDRLEEIDGHQCYVIEAIGVLEEGVPHNHRIWINPERDYRPLKMECYKQEEGLGTWDVLLYRISHIKLENFDGIWFPVKGERQWFSIEMLPPAGITKDEFKEKYSYLPIEKKMQLVQINIIPDKDKRIVTISDVRINKEIDPKNFTVVFPDGCMVWDDTLQLGYRVGAPKLVSQDVSMSTPNTAVSTIKSSDKKKLNTDTIADNTSEKIKHTDGIPNEEPTNSKSTVWQITLVLVGILAIIIIGLHGRIKRDEKK